MTLTVDGIFAKAWIELEHNLIECAVDSMNEIISANPHLTHSQRELFENIHKQRLSPYREIIHCSDDQLVSNDSDAQLVGFVKEDAFRKLNECVEYAIKRLDDVLIPAAEDDKKAKIFFLRIRADYYRYLAEFSSPEKDRTPFEEARNSYQMAIELAKDELQPTDTVLLGIVLNYSLFINNFMNDIDAAVKLSETALDEYYKANEDREGEVDEHDALEEKELVQSIERNMQQWKNPGDSDLNDDDDE